MDFFKVSAEDISKATTGDKAVFVNNEAVMFTIKELKQKQVADKDALIIDCGVTSESAASNGKDYAFFVKGDPHSVKTWVKILRCFFTDEQIAQGIDPLTLIGEQFTSTAKMSTKEDKTYTNFYEFAPVSTDPVGSNVDAKKFDLF